MEVSFAMIKSLFYFLYCVAGAVISYFLPENSRFTLGFIMAIVAEWAYKTITTKEVRNG